MPFERRHQPLLPRALFFRRVVRYGIAGVLIVLIALVIGIAGYRLTEGMSLLDAFLNASMILGGMGPTSELHTVAGKVFAGCYALFSGIVFLLAFGVIVAPLAHRTLHHFHLELGDKGVDGE